MHTLSSAALKQFVLVQLLCPDSAAKGGVHSVVEASSKLWSGVCAGDGELLMLERLSCLLRTGTAQAQQQVQQELAGRHASPAVQEPCLDAG